MLPHEVWEGSGVKARTLRVIVTPLSWLYAFGWQAYLATYAIGVKKAKKPHSPIICVGNLVVGGSGKSPLTMHVARLLLEMGKQVVVGCSGYGAPHAKEATIAPSGPLSASEWGDEPAMIRWLLPEVSLVVGRNRVLAAELVHESFPRAALVMDDGFQHLPLAKQLTIVLDEKDPPNTRCLPAGPYREPRRNRERADLIVPKDFEVVRQPMRIVKPNGEETLPGRYAVVCALGDPTRFLNELDRQFPNGLNETPRRLLPDHDPLVAADLWDTLPLDYPIVVTAKDWVKLRERPDIDQRNILIALQEVELEPRREFRVLIERSFDE
jgi:tetraacyldisaccharide 4'-kinase